MDTPVTNTPGKLPPQKVAVQAPLGLTGAEVALRRAQYGRNVLAVRARRPIWREFGSQMVHFFAVMLWTAAALAIAAGMPQLGIAIVAIIIVNAVFAFLQEYRAERAVNHLAALVPRRTFVWRAGSRDQIDSSDLVVDDIVLLQAGDSIPADMEVLTANLANVDLSPLTGEATPVAVKPGDGLFAGTFLMSGEAMGRSQKIGHDTRLAQIVKITQQSKRPKTPMAVELEHIVRRIAIIAGSIGVIFLGIFAIAGAGLRDGVIFAIGVTVALVPEGLLPTVTLSLAMGAQRMSKRRALVRRLESVQTLGSTTFICVDKTGTLTEHEMNVVEVWTPAGTVLIRGEGYRPEATVEASPQAAETAKQAALAGAVTSTGKIGFRDGNWIAIGDPMEAALHACALRLGGDPEQSEPSRRVLERVPFDSSRRRVSVKTSVAVMVKGAPDAVLPLCRTLPPQEAVAEMSKRGLRVLAIAERKFSAADCGRPIAELERDLLLLGLIGISNPPRPQVRESIEQCRQAGIRVAMVTGDHAGTALAVAREVGLLCASSVVVEGPQLPGDEALLGALLDRDGAVAARVSPEDKLRIASALRARGHVVAMTGDGVNDGPALRAADIGVAMGRSGTDVAREAADLVLLDDHFATIVAAIEEGRTTFANVRRFLTYHLTDNVAELVPFVVWALSGARIPLALNVLQILCLDVGTDQLPALALGAEPPRPGILSKRPGRHILDRGVLARAFGVLGPTEAAVAMLAFLATFWSSGWRPGGAFPDGAVLTTASGAAFAAVILGQVATAFACRSTRRWPGTLGWTTNRLLIAAVLAEVAFLVMLLTVPAIAAGLHHGVPTIVGASVAMCAIPAVLAADLLQKAWGHRKS